MVENDSASEGVYLDTINDDALTAPPVVDCRCDMCQACRLIDRQRKVIEQLRAEIAALKGAK